MQHNADLFSSTFDAKALLVATFDRPKNIIKCQLKNLYIYNLARQLLFAFTFVVRFCAFVPSVGKAFSRTNNGMSGSSLVG